MADLYSKIPPGHFSNIISRIENQDEFNQMIARRRASRGYKRQETKIVNYDFSPELLPATANPTLELIVAERMLAFLDGLGRGVEKFAVHLEAFAKSEDGRALVRFLTRPPRIELRSTSRCPQ